MKANEKDFTFSNFFEDNMISENPSQSYIQTKLYLKKKRESIEKDMFGNLFSTNRTFTHNKQNEYFEVDDNSGQNETFNFTACFLKSHEGRQIENCNRPLAGLKEGPNLCDNFDSAFACSNLETSPLLWTPYQKEKSTSVKNQTPNTLFENEFLKSFSDQCSESSPNNVSLKKKEIMHHSYESDSLFENGRNVLLSNPCINFSGNKGPSIEVASDYSQYDSEKVFGIRR